MTRLNEADLWYMNPANNIWSFIPEDEWPMAVHDIRKLLVEIEELKKDLAEAQDQVSTGC